MHPVKAEGLQQPEGNPVLGAPAVSTPSPGPSASRRADPGHSLLTAIDRARQNLLGRQVADGHWVGELQGDTILESEYVLLMAFLGREHEARVTKAARYILRQQLPEGGWNNYPDG